MDSYCLKTDWTSHIPVPSTLSVFHHRSSFSAVRDRWGNLPLIDHPDWRTVWKLLSVPFAHESDLSFLSTGRIRIEMGREEGVIQAQARKAACTPRQTATGTLNIGQGDVLQVTLQIVFHLQSQY